CRPTSPGESRWAAMPEPITTATRKPAPSASATQRRHNGRGASTPRTLLPLPMPNCAHLPLHSRDRCAQFEGSRVLGNLLLAVHRPDAWLFACRVLLSSRSSGGQEDGDDDAGGGNGGQPGGRPGGR